MASIKSLKSVIEAAPFDNGRTAEVFFKHDDGRINAQVRNARGRAEHNLTLKPGEFNVDEAFVMVPHHVAKTTQQQVLDAHNKATGSSISKRIGKNVRAIPGSSEMKFAESKTQIEGDIMTENKLPSVFNWKARQTTASKKGTYGTSYSAEDDEHDEKPSKKPAFDTDYLAHALGVVPKKSTAADERRLKQAAAGYGPKGVSVRRHVMKEGIEYIVLKEGVTFRYEILDEEGEVVSSGRAATENGAAALAERKIDDAIALVKEDATHSALAEAKRVANLKHLKSLVEKPSHIALDEGKMSEIHAGIHDIVEKPGVHSINIGDPSTHIHKGGNYVKRFTVYLVKYHKGEPGTRTKESNYGHGYQTYVHHEEGSTDVKPGLPPRLGGEVRSVK